MRLEAGDILRLECTADAISKLRKVKVPRLFLSLHPVNSTLLRDAPTGLVLVSFLRVELIVLVFSFFSFSFCETAGYLGGAEEQAARGARAWAPPALPRRGPLSLSLSLSLSLVFFFFILNFLLR